MIKSKMENILVDFGVSRDCINPDSYYQICVHCNACGRFDMDTMWQARRKLYIRRLKEHIENMEDEQFYSQLQQSNIAEDIITFGKELKKCVPHIWKEDE